MACFRFVLCASLLLLANLSLAFPIPFVPARRGIAFRRFFCSFPVALSWRRICPRQGNQASVPTVKGWARGVRDDAGVSRFAVKYADAPRWENSSVVQSWQLPDGATDPEDLPKMCAQVFADSDTMTEDCLSMILYVPPGLNPTSNVPTMLWIHGGSFIVGSATGTGIDGSNLAVATNSIVAVMQYRLGALGFLSPDGKTNLAVEDAKNALTFLSQVVGSFGGTSSKITVAGQSSGATLVRALLAAPSASSLFQGAILQSDTFDAGFLAPSAQQNLQNHFNGLIGCSSLACASSLPLSTILDNTFTQFLSSASVEPQAGDFAPIRPVRDDTLVSVPLTTRFPETPKPVLVTTVQYEAGNAIFSRHPSFMSEADFVQENVNTFGQDRADIIVASPNYEVPAEEDARPQLEKLGTDYIWKCSAWTFARGWAANSGDAFVGMYTLGSTFPDNSFVDFCLQDGVTCHQDDIEIVFGNVPNPSPAQSALVSEMQTRYKSFLENGNPNAPGLSTWTAAGSTDVHTQNLGGSSDVPVGACDPSFWGDAVEYDYQVYGL